MFTCHLFSPLFPSYCTSDWPRLLFPSLQRAAGAGRAPQRTASARTAGRPAGTPRSGAYLVGHGLGLGARLRTPGQAFTLRSIVCPASNALHRQSDSGIGGPGPPQRFWGKALLLEPLCPGVRCKQCRPSSAPRGHVKCWELDTRRDPTTTAPKPFTLLGNCPCQSADWWWISFQTDTSFWAESWEQPRWRRKLFPVRDLPGGAAALSIWGSPSCPHKTTSCINKWGIALDIRLKKLSDRCWCKLHWQPPKLIPQLDLNGKFHPQVINPWVN